jgi:hypothetical protein
LQEHINQFFDVIKLCAKRLPDLGELIVQLLLIALVVLGARALLNGHP